MCRRDIVILLLSTSGLPVHADVLKRFPWFNRGDPKIQTDLFLRAVDLSIEGRRIVVYPFEYIARGRPEPIPFGPVLEQALLQERTAAAAEYHPEAPWQAPLPPQVKEKTDKERIAAAVADGLARGADYVVVGRIHAAFRTAGGGLIVKVSLHLISANDGRTLWYGRKRADWIRHFPIEDCFLHLAWSFIEDWRGAK